MKILPGSSNLDHYLKHSEIIDFTHPEIQLKSQGIPTGFCYQRLMVFDTPEKGYSLHALHGVFLRSLDRWIRLDARGNKAGVQAQFSIDKERLAFTINEDMDEKDFLMIYTSPIQATINTLKENRDAIEMCWRRRAMVYNKPRQLNKTANFIKEAEKVKMKLECKIKVHKLGQGKDGTIGQLKNFYKDVELMIKSKSHIPSYPRAITDSWDVNSVLGKQLLDLYEVYKRLR
ncbi:hypothetical protein ABEV80_03515 [Heyndrickxia ginsengihumi]|nr:hypothetical protein [Heyndrickxia ginsengihumi]